METPCTGSVQGPHSTTLYIGSDIWRHPVLVQSKDAPQLPLTSFTQEHLQAEALKLFKVNNILMFQLLLCIQLSLLQIKNFTSLRYAHFLISWHICNLFN